MVYNGVVVVHINVTAVQMYNNGGISVARQSIDLPNEVKSDLEKMSKDIGMSQNGLANLAIATMLAKYKAEGMKIFFDLISQPDTRKPK